MVTYIKLGFVGCQPCNSFCANPILRKHKSARQQHPVKQDQRAARSDLHITRDCQLPLYGISDYELEYLDLKLAEQDCWGRICDDDLVVSGYPMHAEVKSTPQSQ